MYLNSFKRSQFIFMNFWRRPRHTFNAKAKGSNCKNSGGRELEMSAGDRGSSGDIPSSQLSVSSWHFRVCASCHQFHELTSSLVFYSYSAKNKNRKFQNMVFVFISSRQNKYKYGRCSIITNHDKGIISIKIYCNKTL